MFRKNERREEMKYAIKLTGQEIIDIVLDYVEKMEWHNKDFTFLPKVVKNDDLTLFMDSEREFEFELEAK